MKSNSELIEGQEPAADVPFERRATTRADYDVAAAMMGLANMTQLYLYARGRGSVRRRLVAVTESAAAGPDSWGAKRDRGGVAAAGLAAPSTFARVLGEVRVRTPRAWAPRAPAPARPRPL